MSSATSTDASRDQVRLKADPTRESDDRGVGPKADQGLQPWHFFLLAALGCATALTFIVRGQGVTPVILLTVLMGATGLVGLAALRTVRPLVTAHHDRTRMIGDRTRAALEREKMLALRAIKELEFDRAMGKVSADDFHEMSGRLRARAGRLMRQLDASAGYRERIERDLAKRLGEKALQDGAPKPGLRGRANADLSEGMGPGDVAERTTPACVKCGTLNDSDARFCKECGGKL